MTFPPPRPEAPDADFEALFGGALATVSALARDWTDHNVHDPGITLLDVLLWELADLHYRVGSRRFDAWGAEARSTFGPVPRESPSLLPDLDQGALERLAGAWQAAGAELRAAVEGAADESSAARLVFADQGLTGSEAVALARLLRRPRFEHLARDHADVVATVVDAEDDRARAVGALTARPELAGLWPEEAERLVDRERRRRVERVLLEDAATIREVVGSATSWADALADLGTRLGFEAADQPVALAVHPCPPFADAEDFEHGDGSTRLWPPHPLQVRTGEPVTAGDYRRLALAVPGVKRAWVREGLLAGVRWDGRVNPTDFPHRQGALTLVVEPAPAENVELPTHGQALKAKQAKFLRRVLRRAVGELDTPYDHLRERLNRRDPRRLMGDELAAALVKRCGVVVKGVLHVEPTADRQQVLDEAADRLGRFLSSDGGIPVPPPVPGTCPEDLEGTWPVPPEPPPGWEPGAPVRVSELVELLSAIPGVAGVEALRVRRDTGTTWADSLLALHPDCVPVFVDRQCLQVRVVRSRLCTEADHEESGHEEAGP